MITLTAYSGCTPNAAQPLPDPPPSVPDSGGGGGGSPQQQVFGSSTYSSRTAAFTGDPGASKVMWPNASQWDATQVYISYRDGQNIDQKPALFYAVTPGRILFIRKQSNSADYMRYRINTVTDSGTWVTYDVTPLEHGGTLPFAGNEQLVFSFI